MPAYSELTIYEKGQWFMLDEAETLELFTGLRTDFMALSLASYLANLTDATAQAERHVAAAAAAAERAVRPQCYTA